jgi:hypothetical protein
LSAERGGARPQPIQVEVHANVEHVLLVIKRIFGFPKVRYSGLAKNTNCLYLAR